MGLTIITMNQRSEDILLATVGEYIRTGDPVSSKRLFIDFDFGIRSASIRAELNILEELGWLEQFHISGGRVPTDKALEFFAEKVREELILRPRSKKNMAGFARLAIHGEFKSFVHELSHELHLLSAGVTSEEPSAHISGLDELFNSIHATTSKVFYEIAKDIECLEERMAELLEDEEKNYTRGPRTLIGKKSPLIRNEQVTTVFDIFDINGNRVLFAAFGSRRMDYRKNFSTFITLRKALENYE